MCSDSGDAEAVSAYFPPQTSTCPVLSRSRSELVPSECGSILPVRDFRRLVPPKRGRKNILQNSHAAHSPPLQDQNICSDLGAAYLFHFVNPLTGLVKKCPFRTKMEWETRRRFPLHFYSSVQLSFFSVRAAGRRRAALVGAASGLSNRKTPSA